MHKGGFISVTFKRDALATDVEKELKRIEALPGVARAEYVRRLQYNVYPAGDDVPTYEQLEELWEQVGMEPGGLDSPVLCTTMSPVQGV